MELYMYSELNKFESKHWWHRAKTTICQKLISKYVTTKNPKILDIGCGTGKNIQIFSKIGETWGIDSSPKAIAFCRQKGIRNIKKANSDKTGFKDKSFNLITMMDVLEHVEEDITLKEIHRILDDNGILLVTVPALQALWSKFDVILHHKRRYNSDRLTNAMERNDFKILKISYMFSFLVVPVFLIRVIKSILYKDYYPADDKISSDSINMLFYKISLIEQFFITRWSVPIGTSLICIAVKI